MSPVSAMNSATHGIWPNRRRLNEAAARIAEQPSRPEIAADIADLKTAELGVAVNAAVLRTADASTGILVDLIA